jgi:ATP-dependent RNA helicase RhlE
MTFEDFNFHPDIMKGIRDMRYENPTPIQEQSIPPAMEGRDVIANAQTGSGKTAAFILPLMHRIADMPEGKTRVLVLAPTRELACQIDEQALGFGYHTHIRSACVYGGVRMEAQEQALKDGTAIIVATPGRLLDHHKYGSWRFDELTAVVLDEADRMLDMGFWPDIQQIMSKLPEKRQMLLFSATMPQPIVELAKTFMHDPVHIKIAIAKPPSTINQVFYPVDGGDKLRLLMELMKQKEMKSAIIFCSTKIGADRLYRALHERQLPVGVIHGDREQADRDKVLVDFRSGKVKILVATDVASRGIDVDGVTHVVNFDMPPDPDSYVHRIGRTARAGESGEALSFITHEDAERVHTIETLLERQVERVIVPGFEVAARPARHDQGRGGRPQGGGHSRPQGSGPGRPGQGSGPSRHSDGPRHQGPSGQGPSHRSSGPRHSGGGQGPRRSHEGRPSGDLQGPREPRAPRDPQDARDFREPRPLDAVGGAPVSDNVMNLGAGPTRFNGGGSSRRPSGPRGDHRGGPRGEHRGPRGDHRGPRGDHRGGPRGEHRGGPRGEHRGESRGPRGDHRGGPSSSRPSHAPEAPKKKKPFWWPF